MAWGWVSVVSYIALEVDRNSLRTCWPIRKYFGAQRVQHVQISVFTNMFMLRIWSPHSPPNTCTHLRIFLLWKAASGNPSNATQWLRLLTFWPPRTSLGPAMWANKLAAWATMWPIAPASLRRQPCTTFENKGHLLELTRWFFKHFQWHEWNWTIWPKKNLASIQMSVWCKLSLCR